MFSLLAATRFTGPDPGGAWIPLEFADAAYRYGRLASHPARRPGGTLRPGRPAGLQRPSRRRVRRLAGGRWPGWAGCRSEEHTSELQSHSDLVCRLLLEKKK